MKSLLTLYLIFFSMLAFAHPHLEKEGHGTYRSAAALQLIQCDGNLVKAASGLLSTGVLEGVVKSAVVAGAVPAGIAGNTFSERLVSGFVNGVQRGAIRSLFGDKFDIKEVALSAGVHAAGATVASQIGKAYGDELINGVTHKVLHGALGGATGFALGGTTESAAAGAFGAVVAETLVEITAETTDVLSGRVVNRLEEEGLAPTEENIRSITRAEMQRTMDLGKMGAAIAALFAGQDVNMAAFAATTAVENNAAQAAAIAVMASPHFAALLAGAGLSAAWLTQYQQQKMCAKTAKMDGTDTEGFVDEGLTTEEAKPKVTTTPAHEGPSSSLPGYAAHNDPLPFAEGFDAYDGPDARVFEREGVSAGDEPFSRKAPTQVEPGIRILEGQYINDRGRVESWKAHYDEYGRQIGRTDYNAGNKTQGIPEVHHHTYGYKHGESGRETGKHIPGEYQP